MKKVEGILREQNRYAATFYNIGEHSPISGIRAGVDMFKQSGADIIVSVGGGSPIDASKAIIYFLHEQLGGDFLRQIAIPTTLSAAEYSVRCTLLLRSFGLTVSAKDWRGIYRRSGSKDSCELAIPRTFWRHSRCGTYSCHP